MEKKIEKLVGSPALILGQAINLSQFLGKSIKNQKHVKKGKEYWDNLGPGLTTGASDDDPSGIATYSQAGAQYGFQLLWMAPFTFPLMAIVQEMCARIGLVTGQGLAGNIRDHFPRWILYISTILLLIANTLNIGADLGVMAKATQLIFPQIHFGYLVFGFTIFSLVLQIFTPYDSYAKYLKWLALILLSYVFSALLSNIDWKYLIFHAVVPTLTFSKDQIFLICAIFGTTISPYLFFWQTAQEVEEDIKKGKVTLEERKGCSDEDVRKMRIDVWSGMLLSGVVMFAIIAACAAILYTHGITNITSAADAAVALRPFAGEYAYLLFTLGIIGTGLLAVPVLAGAASYCLSESFGWQYGLHHQLNEANAFYGVIIISMGIGLAINFIGMDAIKALIYAAVVNGLVAPVILALIIILSSSKKIMGKRINPPYINWIGWFVTAIMALAGIGTILSII